MQTQDVTAKKEVKETAKTTTTVSKGNDQENKVNTLPITAEKKENPAEIPIKETAAQAVEMLRPVPTLSAEERIENMKQFEALSNRYNALKEKSNSLKTFKAGNDKLNSKIIFKNAQGYEFEVLNTTVIGKLSEAAEQELNRLLTEAQEEVLSFVI